MPNGRGGSQGRLRKNLMEKRRFIRAVFGESNEDHKIKSHSRIRSIFWARTMGTQNTVVLGGLIGSFWGKVNHSDLKSVGGGGNSAVNRSPVARVPKEGKVEWSQKRGGGSKKGNKGVKGTGTKRILTSEHR